MLVSSRGKIIEFWSRAHTGPICFAQDFDTKVYWPKLKAITKKWGITYDPSQMIPCDDDLLDRVDGALPHAVGHPRAHFLRSL